MPMYLFSADGFGKDCLYLESSEINKSTMEFFIDWKITVFLSPISLVERIKTGIRKRCIKTLEMLFKKF